jgi:hypothetical protein
MVIKTFLNIHKGASKELTKCFLKKSQKEVTVTHICRLFTDKSCIKVLQQASAGTLSQNYSVVTLQKKTITNVLTTLDAIFVIKTYVNEVVIV